MTSMKKAAAGENELSHSEFVFLPPPPQEEGYSREKYQQNDLQIDYFLHGISASFRI